MPQFPLPVAKECMLKYNELMKGDDVGKMHRAFSDAIVFNTKGLAEWLNTNNYLENTDSIKICFGVYTPEGAAQAGKGNDEGRVTVFICPTRDGVEIDCYNGGSTLP